MNSSHKSPNKSESSERKEEIQTLMDKASIPGISIASLDKEGKISATVLGATGKAAQEEKVTAETAFGAASLSKLVFAYLVLKLIRDNKTGEAKSQSGKFEHFPENLPPAEEKEGFDLDTPVYKFFPKILDKFDSVEDKERAKKLTPRLMLSHTTGLPIVHDTDHLYFQFEPGTQYGYSGPGIALLQEVIESLTGCDLEKLAQEQIFRKEALDMPNSSFQRDASKPPQAANSLSTTPSDYAKFVRAWLNEPTLQYAFEPKGLPVDHSKPGFSMLAAFLPKDWPIQDAAVLDADKQQVSWGLGMGLQLDEKGNAISAYHSGDMGEWRAWVAINLQEKSAIVYFSNSPNGHLLAEKIIPPSIKLDHVFNFFFKTYGFARNLDELAEEKGPELANGLRKGCLSPPEVQKSGPYQTPTLKPRGAS